MQLVRFSARSYRSDNGRSSSINLSEALKFTSVCCQRNFKASDWLIELLLTATLGSSTELAMNVKAMAGSALRRLMAEYKQLTLNPPEGIIAGPIIEENFFEWEALITGPEGTCFEGGVFPAKLIFPPDYPLSPPKMQFTCEMFHPNIYADGRVCISILHAPGDDPMGYESSAERWSPVQSVEKILLSVVSMLAEPNDESGANVDAAKMWREDRTEFERIAQKLVRKTLGIPS